VETLIPAAAPTAASHDVRTGAAPRFVVVGGLTASTDFSVLALLHGALGMPLASTTAAAFAAAFAVNFTLSRRWTFPVGRNGSPRAQLIRFTALVIVNLIVTIAVVTGLAALGVNYLVAKAVATIAIASANFVAYRHWVFR
jgi:putative flippase GtrA